MAMPEISDLRFQIDQFDAVRKAVMDVFDMLVMDPIALDKACLNAMEERLFDTGQFGVSQKMSRHARRRHAVPEPGRARLG